MNIGFIYLGVLYFCYFVEVLLGYIVRIGVVFSNLYNGL